MRVIVDEFVQHLQTERGLSKNTLAAYRSDLRQFEAFVRKAGHGGWDIPPRVVRAFMTDLLQREYRQASRARKLAAVKALYRYLRSVEAVASDPAAGLDGARVARRRPRIISTAEVERLLDQAADAATPERMRDRAMLEALYATGMRVSELVGLDVDDVDCWAREIVLGRNSASARTVPLTERSAEALQVYLANGREKMPRRVDESAVFLNHRGARLTRQGFWLIIKTYARRSNIQTPITPHTLRHSFAAHRLQGDSSVREVQQLLGHASPATTQVYADLARESQPQTPGGSGAGRPA
jgi:integrase/recombinase XerD